MTIRNYGSYDDDALRRVLGADPDDIDAVIEAAKRFERVAKTDAVIEAAKRFERVAKTDAEFEELEEKIDELEGKLQEANDEAQSWREDFLAEQRHSDELHEQIDTLQERVTELESSGAGLV